MTANNSSKPTKLQQIKDQWSSNPPDPPTEAQQKKLIARYRKAVEAREKLHAEHLERAEKIEAEIEQAVIDMLMAFGPRNFEIDGQVLEPWCRGDRIFFRTRPADVVRIGKRKR